MVVVGGGRGGGSDDFVLIFKKYIPYARIKKGRGPDRIPLPSLEISNLLNSYDSYDDRKIIEIRPSNDP